MTTITYTKPQLDLLKQALGDTNFDRFNKVTFVFKRGKLADVTAELSDNDDDQDFAGPWLTALYARACRGYAAGRAPKGGATILQFPRQEQRQ